MLVVVTSVLKPLSTWAHGIVFTSTFGLYIYLTYKIIPFNYQRCNLWELMSLLGVFWISFLATVSNVKNPENFLWFFVLVLG